MIYIPVILETLNYEKQQVLKIVLEDESNDMRIIDRSTNRINISNDCTSFLVIFNAKDKEETFTLMVCLILILILT
jgi:S-adenosylmethionine synthetase